MWVSLSYTIQVLTSRRHGSAQTHMLNLPPQDNGTGQWGPLEVSGPKGASSLGAFIREASKDLLPCPPSEGMAERHHSRTKRQTSADDKSANVFILDFPLTTIYILRDINVCDNSCGDQDSTSS